jgi:hypothetical protein
LVSELAIYRAGVARIASKSLPSALRRGALDEEVARAGVAYRKLLGFAQQVEGDLMVMVQDGFLSGPIQRRHTDNLVAEVSPRGSELM